MKILFVTIADSPHAFRWMQQLDGLDWDLHLMPVWQVQPPHRALTHVTIHDLFRQPAGKYDPSVREAARIRWPFAQGKSKAQRLLQRITFGHAGYPARIARLIRTLNPDIVHTMEMQQAGYMMAECRRQFQTARSVPWIYSCWGNDIYHFEQRPEHSHRVREVITSCDYFMADCHRDVDLAQSLGLKGRVLGVYPTGGGYDIARVQSWRAAGPVSARRTLAIKGYHDEGPLGRGRGLVALRALRRCVHLLRDYELVIYLGTEPVLREARLLASEHHLKVTILPPSHPDEILKLMGRSRVGIGLSISDGMPNTMLEAMIMGAFPIQSDTVSPREYLVDGSNGFIVPPEDEEAVALALKKALTDDQMVDRAAEANLQLVAPLERAVVRDRVVSAYRSVLESSIRNTDGG